MSLAHESEQPPFPPHAPVQPPVPPKPSKLKRFGLPIGLLLLGLVIGGVSGASAVPEPVVQVQEKVVEKKVTVNVPTTPQSCLNAIQYGEEVIESSTRVMQVLIKILDAVKTLDAAAINRLNPQIDTETTLLGEIKPKYQSARDSCQASR
jgi:gas vesicle protein